MGFLEWAVGSIVVGVVAFQVWLTRRVFRSSMFERRQKILQAQLIWLVPILGAGLVFSVLQEESKNDGQPPSHLKS
jgi:putative copper export protein